MIVPVAGSTATESWRSGQERVFSSTTYVAWSFVGGDTFITPRSPAARAAATTASMPTSATGRDPAPELFPAVGRSVTRAGPGPASADWIFPMLAPAYVDQVMPVTDSPSRPTEAHTPATACQDMVRLRPFGPRCGTNTRRTRLRARGVVSHSARPPSISTHSQLAAISL